MKNTNICPKCQSNEILRIEGQANGYGAGNNIHMGNLLDPYVLIPRYVCCRCGYSEEWIDQKDIPRLVKHKLAKNR